MHGLAMPKGHIDVNDRFGLRVNARTCRPLQRGFPPSQSSAGRLCTARSARIGRTSAPAALVNERQASRTAARRTCRTICLWTATRLAAVAGSRMPLVADFSSWFNKPDDADVLLHLSTADPAADTAEYARTYHAHAVLLRAGSDFFKARLTKAWQQQQPQRPCSKMPHQSGPGAQDPCIHYELVEHVEEGELEAMEQLLRLMYSFKVPADTPTELLLQMLRLADRYQAQRFTQLLLSHLAAKGKDAITLSAAVQTFSMPPGVKTCPAFKELLHICSEVIVSQYTDVPAVIQSDELRQQFCKLPHAAVLAWAVSDKLRVHNENCVVYLLSAWVKTQKQQQRRTGGQGVSPAQLEQLAHQVRVLQLGPAYQFFVLPKLLWFKGCSGMARLGTLLAYKGATSTGKPVFPSPARCGTDGSDTNAWEWDGPAAWVAGPRQLLPAAPRSLKWDLGPEDLQQLYEGGLNTPVQCTPHLQLYANGFQLCLQLYCEEPGEGHTLGVYFRVSHQLMSQHGVPWPDTASVSLRKLEFKVIAAAGATAVCSALLNTRSVAGHSGWGCADVLGRSAPTLEELVAPLLVDGKLQLEMTVEGVDLLA